ncbi:MAG: hypothetical protein ABEN55_09830 [Bradymonadaceae bacterium]
MGPWTGSAIVYRRQSGTWEKHKRLLPPDAGQYGDERYGGWRVDYGWSVALEGDTALVGAPRNDEPGVVYVYIRSGGKWQKQTTLTDEDAVRGNRDFGYSLALEGDTAVVGFNPESPGTPVSVFTRDAGRWTRKTRLKPTNRAVGAPSFGQDVALAENTLAVGSPWHKPDNQTVPGSVFVFTRTGNSWSQQTRLPAPKGLSDVAHLGSSVTLQGDVLLAGAPNDAYAGTDEAGSTLLYTRIGGSWSRHDKFGVSNAAEYDHFGGDIALDADTVLLGSHFVDGRDEVDSAGRAYAYELQPDADGDGIADNRDNCSSTANPDQIDTDEDNKADACETCDEDPDKTSPGMCGCGELDTDSDGDGTADCEDACPENPGKTGPLECGCATPDTDEDGDGTVDCLETIDAGRPGDTGSADVGPPDRDSNGPATDSLDRDSGAPSPDARLVWGTDESTPRAGCGCHSSSGAPTSRLLVAFVLLTIIGLRRRLF